MPKSRVIHFPWLTPSRGTYNAVDTVKPRPISGEQLSDTVAEILSSQPTGRLLCALALVCVGSLISDFSSARCNRRSTSVNMVQIRDDCRKMGPADVGKMEGEYEQSPDFRRFVYGRRYFLS
jgi:hypothetical protein